LATENEEVSGTPSYMAPEQATAGAQMITPATDIWGLGAILYEFVTGQPPFIGDSAQDTLKLVVHGDLHSPRSYEPRIPRDLEAIILKCMTRDVAMRYPTARALADDLGRFIEHRPVYARRLNGAQRVWRWARRQPYIAALSLLFTISMLAGIIGVATQWKRAETNARHAIANAGTSSERLWESRREAALRLETDGKGFEALPGLIANIEEQEKAGNASTNSIERREIGMILHRGVTLIDRMILPDAHPLAAELSADGSILAVALGDQSVRWFDTRTMAERGRVDLSRLPTSSGEDIAPRLLRFIDDKRLLVTLDWPDYMVNPNNHDSDLIDLEHARVVEPPAQFADRADAIYSANGRYALLFDQQDGRQFWQVEPWRALSARTIDKDRRGDGWLLGRDGSYALGTTGSDRINLSLFDPRNPTSQKMISLPGFAQVTAWAENNSGSLIALGDSTGHVYILDPHTGALRPLSTPRGTHVNWLAFSEDDAWVAAVRRDGAAFAFDVASGDPLNAGQMQQDVDVRQVAISHRDRLLVASGFGQTVVWRFPQPGPTGLTATRLISSPTRSLHALTNAVGVSLQTGLLATTDIGGEVRLWRLPRASLLPVMQPEAGMSMSGSLYFDGKHLADVAWNKLRVVSMDGATSTPWITLPQPLAYAQLLDDGKTMLATSGPAMYVFDAASMRHRY
ncbi:MAG TPA: protein kinase family protein, partial [Xanthomonadaceae bacterium]|nr:protein kinase family protein [Xanthomonadaceae bacterium]